MLLVSRSYGVREQVGDTRRLLHKFLNTRAVERFDEYQNKHSRRLLLQLAETPENFFKHVEFAIAALTMEVTYGMSVTSEDSFLQAVMEAAEAMKKPAVPGTFLVDTIPMLKYVPEWFPGAGFQKFARVARERSNLAVDGPLEYVKELMKSDGVSNVSIARLCFDHALESEDREHEETITRAATGSIFVAAVETRQSCTYSS